MGSGGRRGGGVSTTFRIYLLAVAAASLIAVLIVILVAAPRRGSDRPSRPPVNEGFAYHKIRIPEEKLNLIPAEPMRVRPRRESWSEEEVDRFWIPPEPIVGGLLKEENRRVLEDIFDDIP